MISNYVFLVIEDNSIDQIVTSQLLKKVLAVQEVNVVKNGSEGMNWLYNYSNPIHKKLIILVDIKMGEMGGFEFLSEFEKLPEELKEKTQIFMLSSSLCPDEKKQAEGNKYVKSILSKPLPAKELGEIIFSSL